MNKYVIKFKYSNRGNIENLFFFDNNNNKKVRDIKEFINCFDNSICSCMLSVSCKHKNYAFFNNEQEFEDEFELHNLPKRIIYIVQKSKECRCKFLSKKNNNNCLSKRSLIEKINNLDTEIDNYKSIKFHDIIININSLCGLKNGWKIEMTEKGEKKYNIFRKEQSVVIGIIGKINKGKSFLLTKLTQTNIPPGVHINNKGLCVKFLDISGNSSRNIIFLDTMGSDQPILGNNNESNNIIATNLFLQNYIISNSDILLLVVDNLSLSEQKLINKIKSYIKRGNNIKKLIIVHNLKTCRKIIDANYYIDNTILKSFTFKLQKNKTVTAKKDNIIGEYYTEHKLKNTSIFHLIFAADKSEAGFYFNNFTKYFIEIHYNDIINLKKFDIFENMKSNLSLQSKIYFNENIKTDDFLSIEEILSKRLFCLKKSKELTLKNHSIEDLGLQALEENHFEPKYSVLKRKNNLEIEVEIPGNTKVNIFHPIFIEDFTRIIISGIKFPDKRPIKQNNNITDIRNYGNFYIKIDLPIKAYKINPNIKSYEIKDGILYLRYQIEDENFATKINLTVDEKI